MSLAKVAGITVIGGGVATATIWALTAVNNDMPGWSPLSSEDNFSSVYTTNKFGNDYKDFLVSTSKSTNWWKWAFQNRYSREETSKQEDFKDLSDSSKLISACKKVFSAETEKIKSTETTTTGEYYEKIIWKVCSPLGNKPVTVSEKSDEKAEYETGKLGSDETESKKLVSVNAEENAFFWKVRQKLFFSDAGKPQEGDKFFNAFYKQANRGLLKDKCKGAYKLQKGNGTSTENQPTVNEVLKYCSLKGS